MGTNSESVSCLLLFSPVVKKKVALINGHRRVNIRQLAGLQQKNRKHKCCHFVFRVAV